MKDNINNLKENSKTTLSISRLDKLQKSNDIVLKAINSFTQNEAINKIEVYDKTISAFTNNIKYHFPLDDLNLVLQQNSYILNTQKILSIPLSNIELIKPYIEKQQFWLTHSTIIQALTMPLTQGINMITDTQKLFINNIAQVMAVNNPFFNPLYQTLEELKSDPNNILNWLDYCDKLSEYFWIIPYKMTVEELQKILLTVNNEKEFDKCILKYFNKEKVNSLINDIRNNLDGKQSLILFEQIVSSYNNKFYSLVNTGLMSIIDNLLSFYLLNKGCNSRVKLFEPIIKDIEDNDRNLYDFLFIVMMINSNINLLYEKIEFNKKIRIKTNKKARRNPVSHGKLHSNKRIDTIMLLNTLYYLLLAKNKLKGYKDSLCYNRNKNTFYFPTKDNKKKIKKAIKDKIIDKNLKN